ncbi:MAG TPA: glycosyltransferase family 2 protein [Pyrinomonadaceae bacterium]|jgi:glycosyltransferase involved in cell wall biosynthesis|nr:glycosyltransferase family 2 protein [Pyrinomonadaceae bacterium]
MAISEESERLTNHDASPPDPNRESVSVVIPCLNEEHFIGGALRNLADQYDSQRYEIIVVDGFSQDRTREVIAEFRDSRPDISLKLLDNPSGRIPSALNIGIQAAQGEIIARLDAHAVASPGYVRRSVEVLRQEGVGVVGMPCQICAGADTLTAKAIAMAVSHPFGIGDARYRLRRASAPQQAVDTVAFACFRKALWRELGGFDEQLSANEDYEFNYRVRQHGQAVLLDQAEHCDYFARATIKKLWSQYWRYGRWKARMILSHPASIKLRQMVAPIFVASIPILLAVGFWMRPAWPLLAVELAVYLICALSFGIRLWRKSGESMGIAARLPLIFGTIHIAWGIGFWSGLIRPPRG